MSETEMLRTASTFQRCIDYIDIAARSSVRRNLVSCVQYTKAAPHLPLY